MHKVELLEQYCEIAQRLGYQIRHEWLGGTSGGACEFSGRKWIFIDFAISPEEQVEQVAEALRNDPGVYLLELNDAVAESLQIRGAA